MHVAVSCVLKKGSVVIMYSQHAPAWFHLLPCSFPEQRHRCCCLIGGRGCAAVRAVALRITHLREYKLPSPSPSFQSAGEKALQSQIAYRPINTVSSVFIWCLKFRMGTRHLASINSDTGFSLLSQAAKIYFEKRKKKKTHVLFYV